MVKKQIKKQLFKGAFLTVALLLVFCSCSPCSVKPCVPVLCKTKRPYDPIMVSSSKCVIDYTPQGWECCDELNGSLEGSPQGITYCMKCSSSPCVCKDSQTLGQQIDPSYFDPYATFSDGTYISTGDVLEVTIHGDVEPVVYTAIVGPDGFVYIGVLEGIFADGLTVAELSEKIKEKAKDLYLDPTVTVIPQVNVGQSFTVMGWVNGPGVYPLQSTIRLRQAIGMAGGLYTEEQANLSYNTYITPYRRSLGYSRFSLTETTRTLSNLKESFIVRNGEKLNVDFERLMYSGDESQNIYVRPGDYIYIAPADTPRVYILGKVSAPLALPYRQRMSLIGALNAAGGWSIGNPYSSDIQRILILRGNLNCPCYFTVNLQKILSGEARDVILCPGDIVYVPEKRFAFIRELVDIAVRTFVYTFVSDTATVVVDKAFNNNRNNR